MEANVSTTIEKDANHSHTLPPDKRQFEKEIRVLDEEIKKRETQLKQIPQHSAQEIASELTAIAGQLQDIEARNGPASAEVKATEDELRKLGDKLVQRRDDASKLMVGLKHKTQAGFDGSIGKLESQLQSKQFSTQEERKLMVEIENLKKSKEVLKDYTEAKNDVDKLTGDQEQLRKRRDSLYRQRTDNRRSVSVLKDKQAELRKLQLEEKQKEHQASRETLKKEIDALYKKRASIRENFRQQMSAYLAHKQSEGTHRGEESRRREEDRRLTREARLRRREVEKEMASDWQTQEKRLTCLALITHLSQLTQQCDGDVSSSSPSLPTEGSSSPSLPTGDQEAQLTTASEDAKYVAVPGRFLRRKGDDEDEEFVSSRRRSKKDKKRGGASSAKAFRKFNHNATIISQFVSLGLTPPLVQSDIPQCISQLHEVMASCETKLPGTDSETGDSGIGVEVLSQEELSEYSPKAPVTPPPDPISTDDESHAMVAYMNAGGTNVTMTTHTDHTSDVGGAGVPTVPTVTTNLTTGSG